MSRFKLHLINIGAGVVFRLLLNQLTIGPQTCEIIVNSFSSFFFAHNM